MRVMSLVLILVLLSGCVSVGYNVETRELKYKRLFTDQKLSDVTLWIKKDGSTKFSIGGQESEAEAAVKVAQSFLYLLETARNTSKVAAGV